MEVQKKNCVLILPKHYLGITKLYINCMNEFKFFFIILYKEIHFGYKLKKNINDDVYKYIRTH